MMTADYVMRYVITKFFNAHLYGGCEDMAIFSSPRSGSTWLMEMISQARGVKFIAEPLYEAYVRHFRLLERVREHYVTVGPGGLSSIIRYIETDDCSGFCGPVNPLHHGYHFISTRRVIKITNANALLPVLVARTNINFIYLIRHPIPQILSARRYPYKSAISYYVEDAQFMEKCLTHSQQRLARDIYRSGTSSDKYIVGWCLDNILPLRIFRDKMWNNLMLITYEDLVTNTLGCMNKISKALGLRFRKAGKFHADTPSWSSRFSSADRIAAIQSRNRWYLVGNWRKRDLSEFDRLDEILGTFGIRAYRKDALFADRLLRLRG